MSVLDAQAMAKSDIPHQDWYLVRASKSVVFFVAPVRVEGVQLSPLAGLFNPLPLVLSLSFLLTGGSASGSYARRLRRWNWLFPGGKGPKAPGGGEAGGAGARSA